MSRYTEEFEKFWKAYPCRWHKDLGIRVKRKKYPAFEKWQKLSQEIREECLAKTKHIQRAEGAYVRDAVTWLNQYGWEDIESPTSDPAADAVRLAKHCQEIRAEYLPYLKEQTNEWLNENLANPKNIIPKWLIREVLAERTK